MSITGGELPADLAAVVDAWDMLPRPVKDGILAMVRAAKKKKPLLCISNSRTPVGGRRLGPNPR